MFVSDRLASVGNPKAGAQDNASTHSDELERARLRALAILDCALLALAVVLAQATSSVTGVAAVTSPLLVLFTAVCLVLLTWSRQTVVSGAVAGLFAVPLLTGVAASTLALAEMATVDPATAWLQSLRPWLLATAYILAGRTAFFWATSDIEVGRVAEVVDRAAKRAFDITVAVMLLLFLAPVLLIVSVAIVIEDRGPVFFRCRRIGEGGSELRMIKFRKMRCDADGPPLTSSDDDRFTKVGRFLARSKLDELPQLLNVVCGDMSLVGPRPEDPSFVEMHRDDFAQIFWSKPGMTGLCQLAFAKESRILNPEDRVRDYVARLLPQKIDIDLLYARRRTFAYDLKILVWTVVAVLLRKDVAVNRATGDLTIRRRAATVSAADAA